MGAPNRSQRRAPSQAAYIVALAGVCALLLLLCCYFVYFCVKRVKELSQQPDLSSPIRAVKPAPTPRPAYPVHSVVREGATAMARLVTEMPTIAAVTTDAAVTKDVKVTSDAEVTKNVTLTKDATVTITTADVTTTVPKTFVVADTKDTLVKDQDVILTKNAALTKTLD